MGTTLSDIIVPELFNPYVIQKTLEKSALVQSGIVQNDAEFDKLASQASPLVNMPFFSDLTGESETVIEGDDLTADKISSKKDVASNILDMSSASGNGAKWSGSAFIDAQQLLGDNKAELTAVVMHSAVEAALRKQDLIDVIQPSGANPFSTYMGKRVIIDDGCPVTGSGSSQVFSTYLFGNGAIALGNGTPEKFVATETDRDKKKGSGVDYLINRKTYILHPRGVKFTDADVANTEGPTRTELANATNWTPVYDPKQIRIVEMRHKI